ncbi:MAG: hypothetical protein JKY01_09020 [Pseudomonadales bacterium]|nr:hypothetical protein [Pseudomonadales bacterium]
MLDSLVLNIPFKSKHLKWLGDNTKTPQAYIPLETLPNCIKTQGNIVTLSDGTKIIEEEKTIFESLPSSHTGMAFKIFERGRNCDPYVMLKCSPSKLLQGHNLYGFDDMRKGARNMLFLLAETYPDVFEMLDYKNTKVSELDLNYSIFIDTPVSKRLFMDHLRYISRGQTKNRGDNYETTVYFGSKKSRHKSLKVYSKLEELEQEIQKCKRKGYLESAKLNEALKKTDRAKQAVRFEATIKSVYLDRRAIPTNLFQFCDYFEANPWAYTALFNDAWKDIFKTLSGQELKRMNDVSVFEALRKTHETINNNTGRISIIKVNRLFAVYQTIKSLGFEHVKKNSSSSTFSRNILDIVAAGISESVLQNLKKDDGAQIIPISKILIFDFSNQVPSNYKIPPDLYGLA